MLFIFLLLSVAAALSRVETVIRSSLYWHSYIRDVDAICDIVTHRLAYRGVFLSTTASCADAVVDSELGMTLRDLYSNYEHMDESPVLQARHRLTAIRAKVVKYCSRGFKMVRSAVKAFPPLDYSECYVKKFIPNDNSTCLPLQTPYVGKTNIRDLNMELCIHHLEHLEAQHQHVLLVQHNYASLPSKLATEISKVWKTQMPHWLLNNSISFEFGV